MLAGSITELQKFQAAEAVARGASVTEACRNAGIARTSWYRLQRDPAFTLMVEQARKRHAGEAAQLRAAAEPLNDQIRRAAGFDVDGEDA